jgi:hypothetical protein
VAGVALVAAVPGFFTGWGTAACSLFTSLVAVYVLRQRRSS